MSPGSVSILQPFALDTLPPSHPDRAICNSNLGLRLGNRYIRTGEAHDLEEAIRVGRVAVDATPGCHTDRANRLNSLASNLIEMFTRVGDMEALEEAFQITQEAVKIMPTDHPAQANYAGNLGTYLRTRYSRTGELSDLEEAIRAGRHAKDSMPRHHVLWARQLNNLGTYLMERYSRIGSASDLEEAIQVTREAVAATPTAHYDSGMYSVNLGMLLGLRYTRTGLTDDLEESIRVSQEALETRRPRGSSSIPQQPRKSTWNLGVRLGDRYLRTGNTGDLEEAIRLAKEVVETTPNNYPSQPERLHNLANRLSTRYQRTGSLEDLEVSIEVTRDTVNATPNDHADRPTYAGNLGLRLGERFLLTGSMEDLQEAIQLCREVVAATPKDHRNRPGVLNNLGNYLRRRYMRAGAMGDLEESVQIGREALDMTPTDYPSRAGRLSNPGSRLASRHSKTGAEADLDEAIRVTKEAVTTTSTDYPEWATYAGLNRINSTHSSIGIAITFEFGQTALLSEVDGFASDAAAAALNAHKGPLAALRFLEQGRGVLGEFSRLQSELEPPTTTPDALGNHIDYPKNVASQRRYETGKELDRLITEIRQQPEFENFLLAPSTTEIQDAAKHSFYRRYQRGLGESVVLSWLWDEIAAPILNTLGFTGPPVKEWPHVWWITTGPLANLPIHAAGYHVKRSSDTVLDRVMSSYSSSVKAIIDGRRRRIPAATPDQELLISMQTTPGHSNLPFAVKEIDTIRDLCKTMELDVVEPPRRKKDVISYMPHCQMFHFAGHGHTNGLDPSKSQLLLEDGKTDPLTVADLVDLNKRNPLMNLISGCQLSGFRLVIGSLWEVNDELCVDMAKMTYEGIRDGGITNLSVCQGLHTAIRHLRDRWPDLNPSAVTAMTVDDLEYDNTNGARDAGPGAWRDDRLPRDVVMCEKDERVSVMY
ncbi:CHAT domain-containing protein [Dactylonectria estremocensis]|uniref:CHAT domain-containing protein n=1 Tax=Dactylonectria estremocensis TaxID=1079267 RepID=A0A9P9J5P4_9HYPO|nr:CHAT domain-containing protein [Dactylonectria estremocensis]